MNHRKDKIMTKCVVSVVAIVCLAGLEVMAIDNHIDGWFFFPVVVAISGIAGYSMETVIKLLKGVTDNGKSNDNNNPTGN